MSGGDLKPEPSALHDHESDPSDSNKIDDASKREEGHSQPGGDQSKGAWKSPVRNQTVEESLSKLKIDNDETDEERLDPLDLKLEEVDLSDTKDCPPIVLIGGDRREIRPRGNEYSIDGKYLLPASLKKWVIVILVDERIALDIERGLNSHVQRFAADYAEYARTKGITIGSAEAIQFVPEEPSVKNTIETMDEKTLKSSIQKLIAKLNDDLIDHAIIIVPENRPCWMKNYLHYLETKEWGSIKKPGIDRLTRSSKMKYDTLCSPKGGKTALISQICLKYNAQLGGVNIALRQTFETHRLKFLSHGYLFLAINVGKLVSWPEPALEGLDIAAAVGLWNLTSANRSHRTQTRVQRSNIAVTEIGLLVRDVIQSYAEREGGSLPTSIIILRNATDEHKVLEVTQTELASIKKMLAAHCKELGTDVPRLTYLRVPIKMVWKVKYKNRHPISNYSKALKYDENELSSLDIRAMIHNLSFLSPRRTSKLWPTPIDLADLAIRIDRRISSGWYEHNKDKYNLSTTLLWDLNEFLTKEMGDATYKNTLYYV